MDRDFATAQRARPAPPVLDPFASPASSPVDDSPAVYRPAHSPPCELAASSAVASASRRKFSDYAGQRRLQSGARQTEAAGDPEALGEGGGGGGGGDGDGGSSNSGGSGGSVYTQLQTELYPHMNFF